MKDEVFNDQRAEEGGAEARLSACSRGNLRFVQSPEFGLSPNPIAPS